MKVDMKGKLGILLSFYTVTTFESKMTELNSHTTSSNNSSKVTIWKCGSVVFLVICPPFVALMTGVICFDRLDSVFDEYFQKYIWLQLCRVSKLQTKTIQFFLNNFCLIYRILSNIFVKNGIRTHYRLCKKTSALPQRHEGAGNRDYQKIHTSVIFQILCSI